MESRKNIFLIRHKLADFHAFLVASGGRVKGTGLRISVSSWEEHPDLILLFSGRCVRKEGEFNFRELKWTMEWWEKGWSEV